MSLSRVPWLGPDVVVHACIPSTQEPEAGGQKFEVSLGYIVRSCLKKQIEVNPKRKSTLVGRVEYITALLPVTRN
jgi:hypothetical protein